MARFRPFRALRYSSDKVGPLDGVVAPPYDVIDNTGISKLYDESPHNVVRLILNRDGHAAAGDLYRSWIDDGILSRDDQPSFYLYSQEFEKNGNHRRTGVIGALHLEPFDTGVVRRHEKTFSHHKEDRLKLTREVKANLSPIFGLYSNPEFSPSPDDGWDSPAEIDVTFDGVRSRVWVLKDPENIARVTAAVSGKTIFIADGHHRYETALNYFGVANPDAQVPTAEDAPDDDAAPASHVLAFLANFEDPGMLILPTHRELRSADGLDVGLYVKSLDEHFTVRREPRTDAGRKAALAALDDPSTERNVLLVALADHEEYLILERPIDPSVTNGSVAARLDVSVLHDIVVGSALGAAGAAEPEISYTPSSDDVLSRVDAGEIVGAVLMRPMRADEMADACMAGELLPQKSTYFYPKLLTGLVFHSLDS